MIKLKIYGRLRKFIGQSEFLIKANSAKEAFSFLINNYPKLKQHIKDQEYCIMAGDLRLTEELLDMQTDSDIKIIPVVHGEILGILVGIGSLIGGNAIAATVFGETLLGTILAGGLTMIGTNLVVDGITSMLTPDPQPLGERQEDPKDQGFSFSGLLNNSKQGVAINIVYGEMLVGSTIISSSVDTFQVVNEA